MDNRERIHKGISRAAWGYVFLYFHIKLETVDIMPSFVGFLLFLSAISCMQSCQRELKLLRPLAVLLAVWTGLTWGFRCMGGTLEGRFLWMDLLADLAQLYFHFQFLTNLASLAEKYQPPETDHHQKLRKCRTVQTVLTTAVMVLTKLAPWMEEAWEVLSVVTVFAGLIAAMGIVIVLFRLRKSLAQTWG